MAKLYYSKWNREFSIGPFSSEDSMRDYLCQNPTVLFEEDEWIISIWEEKYLPKSIRPDRRSGRLDLMLCRLSDAKDDVRMSRKLALDNVEWWVVELKKDEASFDSGLDQLLDYMHVVDEDSGLQDGLKEALKSKVERALDVLDLTFVEPSGALDVRGCLVARSFDLLGSVNLPKTGAGGVSDSRWGKLAELAKSGKFTLVDAARKLNDVTLVELLRFVRGDETIIYANHVLGAKARRRIERINPLDMFADNSIREDDELYFRDTRGTDHKDVACRVVRKRAESDAFTVKILPGPLLGEVPFPERGKETFAKRPLPISGSDKTCSKALHVALGIFSEGEANAHYWELGANNFVRSKDGKTLASLRERFRSMK